jgi:transcriptional regulator
MYVPPAFTQTDPAVLSEFMRQHSFALLLSNRAGKLEASHLPLLYEREPNGSDVLYGHLARANPHWRQLTGDVLAVFSGPHAYISPRWYAADQVVPTWNYAAVHVRGNLSLIEDPTAAIGVLGRLVDFYEQGSESPWSFDPREDWIRRLAAGIVAFRIDVTSIEGKWKMSQNQPVERRLKVIAELESRHDDESRAVADLIRETLP